MTICFNNKLQLHRKYKITQYALLWVIQITLKRQLPAHILRALIILYTNSFVRIAWGAITSDYFSVGNGVKQCGSVELCPFLCLYRRSIVIDAKGRFRLLYWCSFRWCSCLCWRHCACGALCYCSSYNVSIMRRLRGWILHNYVSLQQNLNV